MSPEPRFATRALGVGLVGVVLALWCALASQGAIDPPEPPPAADSNGGGTDSEAPAVVDLESRPLAKIPPGTVIGRGAPEGWSHLIMIAIPTLTREDIRDAPKIATHYARMFKFTLLARTEKGPDGYHLKSVARGFAMTIRGREIIVDSSNTFGGDMGVFGTRILAENEKHIDADVRQIARTPTMCLFDAQAVMRRGTEHVRMVLRHAILVDPATGKEYTYIWLLSRDRGQYAVAEKHLQMIPEGLREARYLSVKRNKFVMGLPTPEAFALMRTPEGTPVVWTADLARLASPSPRDFTRDQIAQLEKTLLAVGRK